MRWRFAPISRISRSVKCRLRNDFTPIPFETFSVSRPFAPRSLPASPLLRSRPTPAVGFPSAGLPSSCAELSERAMSLYPDPSGAPRNGFGASAWASAIMIRLAIGLSFDWKYRGVHTGLHFSLAHSFVGLGFCASVALRAASLPVSMPLSLLSRFLSFYKFRQACLAHHLSVSLMIFQPRSLSA